MIDQQQRTTGLHADGGEPGLTLLDAWLATVATSPAEVFTLRPQLEGLTRELLEAVQITPDTDGGTLKRRARATGRALAATPFTCPDPLERSLKLLDQELAPVTHSPEQLTDVLVGVAGGYAAALQARAVAIERERAQQTDERLRAEAALSEQTDRLRNLSQTHLAILAAESLPTIVDLSIRLVNAMIPTLSTTVVTYDFPAGEFEAIYSDQPSHIGMRRPILIWELIESLRKGGIYYVEDIQTTSAHVRAGLKAVIEVGGRSFLAVPMRYKGELFGALTMTTAQIHGFSPDEITLAREIANAMAVAIQQRRSLEAEREARDREATLREMAAIITSGLELDVVLNTILSQLERVLPTVSSSIMLLEGDRLRVAASRGVTTDAALLADMVERNPPNLMSIVRHGRPEMIPDTRQDPDWVALPGGEYIRCWVGVPLIVKGVGIGILTLDRSKPHSFDASDVELALAFAHQAAAAIENVRLFRQEHLYAEQLEQHVHERTRELEALYGITAATVENEDLQTVLDHSLRHTRAALRFTAGAIFLTDSTGETLEPAAALMGDTATVTELLSQSAIHLLERCLHDNHPYVATLVDSAESGAIACAPLRSGSRVCGVLALVSPDTAGFQESSLKLLATIADQIGAAVENIELRQKIRQAAIIEERERLATELHDAVTQSLYSLSLFAEAAGDSARAGDLVKTGRHLRSVQQIARQALGEMRLLLFELRTEVLAQKGLVNALMERLATVEKRAGIDVDMHAELSDPLPVAIEETFYRLALEALNNSLRHANANKVSITLNHQDGGLTMLVRDDGVGFDPDQATGRGGMGITGMRRRIKKLGGTLQIVSETGQGTCVEVHAPIRVEPGA